MAFSGRAFLGLRAGRLAATPSRLATQPASSGQRPQAGFRRAQSEAPRSMIAWV